MKRSSNSIAMRRTEGVRAAPPGLSMARTPAVSGVGRDLLVFAGLAAATVVLLSFIFPPYTLWPLALVALVPWTVGVCRIGRAWIVHWGSFVAGWAFFLINLTWLMPVTGLGYVALAMYLAIYWPLAAWAVRTGRRAGISPVLTLPVAWVACEFLRGWVMSGFPWLFLAHSFYLHTTFIQISDVTGAYGVTFLAAMTSGWLAELTMQVTRRAAERRWRWSIGGGVLTLLALGGSYAYGRFRLLEADFVDGPRIAVVQADFPLLSRPPHGRHPSIMFAEYLTLAADAAAERPDLIVFPETVTGVPQNREFLEIERAAVPNESAYSWALGTHYHNATSAFARGDYAAANAVLAHLEEELVRRQLAEGLPRLPERGGPAVPIVFGATAIEVFPEETHFKLKRSNSALVYDASGTQLASRYDKTHLVPFGEAVPFREMRLLGFDLHWLYRLLNRLSPFSDGGRVDYSLWPGKRYTAFHLKDGERVWRYGVPICYEDVMPYVPRRFTWGEGGERRVDFLLNISNDGWFLHSAELEQHLAIGTFRAVENRVGIARAVNTGISGFIDPDGSVRRLLGPGEVGHSVAAMRIDDRASFYGRFGDVFAGLCLVLTVALWAGGVITRWLLGLRDRLLRRVSRRSAG